MRIFTPIVLIAAMFTTSGAVAGGAYIDPQLAVNPVSPTQFEVIEARGKGPRGIWCAAALYSINTLGMQRGRIYIAEARGPAKTVQGRKGVVFSTLAIGNVAPTATVTVRHVGANLPVLHALQFCRDYDFNFFDF